MLTREEIRYRLRRARAGGHVEPALGPGTLPGDEGAFVAPGQAGPTPAAVLVGLVDRTEGHALLLTQRAEHLPVAPHAQRLDAMATEQGVLRA